AGTAGVAVSPILPRASAATAFRYSTSSLSWLYSSKRPAARRRSRPSLTTSFQASGSTFRAPSRRAGLGPGSTLGGLLTQSHIADSSLSLFTRGDSYASNSSLFSPLAWFHADRVVGGDRDHRHPDRPAAARRPEGPRRRCADPVQQQPQAARPR